MEDTRTEDGKSKPMDPYKVLGVPLNATDEQIRDAYWALVGEIYPNGDRTEEGQARMNEVDAAYDILRHWETRSAYDATLPHQVLEDAYGGPRELFRREHIERRRKENYELALADDIRKILTYRIMRFLMIFVFVFAVGCILDRFVDGAPLGVDFDRSFHRDYGFLPWILLASSGFILLRRNYTQFNYVLFFVNCVLIRVIFRLAASS